MEALALKRGGVLAGLFSRLDPANQADGPEAIDSLLSATMSTAALASGLGIGGVGTALARVADLLGLAKRLLAIDAPLGDRDGLAERIELALQMAARAAEITATESDDKLVKLVADYLRDERLQGFLLLVLEKMLARPRALADETSFAGPILPAGDVAALATAQAVDVGTVMALLPYVLQVLDLVGAWWKKRREARAGG